MKKKLTLSEIKDLAFANYQWSSAPEQLKEQAIMLPYGSEFVTIAVRALNPKDGSLMQYHRYFNRYGEQVVELGTRYGDWWHPERSKTARIYASDFNEYSKIVQWLKNTDTTITKFKQASKEAA